MENGQEGESVLVAHETFEVSGVGALWNFAPAEDREEDGPVDQHDDELHGEASVLHSSQTDGNFGRDRLGEHDREDDDGNEGFGPDCEVDVLAVEA